MLFLSLAVLLAKMKSKLVKTPVLDAPGHEKVWKIPHSPMLAQLAFVTVQ